MARFGNTNASSLLTAASAALTRQQAYNDSIAGYQFDLSAKSPDDFKTYSDYLNGRLKNTNDPSKALTLQKTLTGAYRSFNSTEISRQTMAVKYGDQSNRDKYAHMVGLYQAALQNGDANLAQSIDSQLASLSITIQNEDIAAANAASAASSKAQAGLNSGYNSAIKEQKQLLNQYKGALASGQVTAKEYNDLVAGADSPLQKIQSLYDQASNDAGLSEDNQAKFADDANTFKTQNSDQSALLDKAKFAQGETPAAVQFNERTGQYEYTPLKQTGVAQRLDEKGNLIGVPINGPLTPDLTKPQTQGDSFDLLQQARTGARGGPLSASQDVLKHYVVDASGNPVYTNPDTGGTIQVATQQKKGDTPQSDIVAPNANADYGLIKDANGKYRFSTAADFTAPAPAFTDLGGRVGRIKDAIVGTLSDLRGNRVLSSLPGVKNIQTALFSRADKAAADSRVQESLRQAQTLAAQRESQARAALVSVAPQTTTNSLGTKLIGPNVKGAPVVPEPVKQAQNTVGTPSFTQKYLPVISKLGF